MTLVRTIRAHVARRCEELGVLVDLAHIQRKGILGVCETATRPPLVSHTRLFGVWPDALMRGGTGDGCVRFSETAPVSESGR